MLGNDVCTPVYLNDLTGQLCHPGEANARQPILLDARLNKAVIVGVTALIYLAIVMGMCRNEWGRNL